MCYIVVRIIMISVHLYSLPGKAGLVQRRLFGMQYPEPAKYVILYSYPL